MKNFLTSIQSSKICGIVDSMKIELSVINWAYLNIADKMYNRFILYMILYV